MHIESTYLRFLFRGEHHRRTLEEGPDEEKIEWRSQPCDYVSATSSSHHEATLDVLSLEALVALDQFEVHHFTFIEGLEAISSYGGMMHEDVFTRFVLHDKTKAFFIIEPLDTSTSHKIS
tara:strand:- start:1170 stop:1529 length:360 start_codon:yes stop_codon:yes gene_type:complete